MYGVIQDAPHVHKRTVTVNPIVRSYHAPGEPPYHKFNCPVCHMVGNTNIGITPGIKSCPLCGVHLNWERTLQVGDQVQLTETITSTSGYCLERGTRGIVCDSQSEQETHCTVQIDGNYYSVPKDKWTILEEPE